MGHRRDYSQVSITVCDKTGAEHAFTRTFDEVEDHPFEDNSLDISQVFPVLFFSQNEIIKIAESEELQIRFIDQFFDFYIYKQQISELETVLEDLDSQFADSLEAFHEIQGLAKEIETRKEQLKEVEAKLKSDVFEKYAKLQKKNLAFGIQSQFLKQVTEVLAGFSKEVDELTIPNLDPEVSGDPALKRASQILTNALGKIRELVGDQESGLKQSVLELKGEYDKWQPIFNKEKAAYTEEIKKLGGDSKALNQKREAIVARLTELAQKHTKAKARSDRLRTVRGKRDEALGKLQEVYKNYSKERINKCKNFETFSAGRIKAILREATNVEHFKNKLMQLKRGSYLKDEEIEKLAESIDPKEFIYAVLRYDYAIADKSKHLKKIEELTNIPLDRVKQLADFLLDDLDYVTLLSLQYQVMPQDRPEIRYNVGNGQYELLKNLSTGQKCTAMLIMALCDGDMPVVIDQPEDSLDISSIWEDVCTKLRGSKNKRQFIFTTHNSSVAVASDTDKFIIMAANSTSGEVVLEGAIDSEDMREEILNYLEGGISTYKLKYLKYDAESRLTKEE